MDTKMNKLRITKNGKGWKFQDGHDFVYTSNDLAELREMFWDMVRLGINSIERYTEDVGGHDGLLDWRDEEHQEATCWVCDGYHFGRGCPVDA